MLGTICPHINRDNFSRFKMVIFLVNYLRIVIFEMPNVRNIMSVIFRPP